MPQILCSTLHKKQNLLKSRIRKQRRNDKTVSRLSNDEVSGSERCSSLGLTLQIHNKSRIRRRNSTLLPAQRTRLAASSQGLDLGFDLGLPQELTEAQHRAPPVFPVAPA